MACGEFGALRSRGPNTCDPDKVELSNLQRQTFFQERDVGRSKVECLARHIKRINAETKVTGHKLRVEGPGDLFPYLGRATLVINCADFPDVSSMNDVVSRACFQAGLPHLLCGGYDGHLSFVGQTVIPYKTSCWECYAHGGAYERGLEGYEFLPITSSVKEGGTLAPIAAITANIHALEAIKVISGYAEPSMINHKGELDFNTLCLHRTYIPRREDCALCGVDVRDQA